MKMRFFDLAKKLSYKSTHHQHKIGGVLVKKSKIISFGFNKLKTHSKSNTPFHSTHCELDTILGVSREDLQGSSIYLFRQHRNGQPAKSRPCIYCYELLKESGVKYLYYTDNGFYNKEKIV